jgi:outer membrane protein OmpA-like peptidoglycan-associated protein
MQVANSTFTDNAILTAFEPLGVVPDYWADLTTQALYLLAVTSSADANLSPGQLDIRSVIVDELSWQSRLNAVRNALPRQVALNVDTLLVDEAIDLSAVCDRAFANFEVGPINFAESSSKFRASAYPRLSRLLALASTCEDSWVSVTGHTDASGSEIQNQRLSLQRAHAVGDYLVSGGLDRTRLLLAGVGSSSPIADDSTRYGRSLNRRIDIELSLAQQNN